MNHITGPSEFAETFGVSRETIGRLELYASLLLRWQKTINLVAPSTVGDVWHRHFADSAQLLALAPAGAQRWLDLGSGGGFPGLVVALMLAERPGSKVTLIESDGRKCAFLREVARQTGLEALLRVDILTSRIEMAANTVRVGVVDVVSARALAPLDRLLGWCQPYFSAGTVGLLPKGREVEAELAAARVCWRMQHELIASRTQPEGRIIVVKALTRA